MAAELERIELTPDVARGWMDGQYTLDAHNKGVGAIETLAGAEFDRLRVLDLSVNKLTMLEGISTLRELRELRVYHNQLSELEALGSTRRLERLFVQNNPLGSLGPVFKKLPALKELCAARTGLSSVQNLNNCRHLAVLDLSDNALADVRGLAPLVQLESLVLRNNKLPCMPRLPGMKKLAELDASGNRFTTAASVGQFAALQVLRLAHNRLASADEFPALPRLEELYLAGNRLARVAPLARAAPQVDVLDVSGNALDDEEDLRALAALGGLRELSVGGNPATSGHNDWWYALSRRFESLDALDGVVITPEDRQANLDDDGERAALPGGRPGSSWGGKRRGPLPVAKPATSRAGDVQDMLTPEQIEQRAADMRERFRSFRDLLSNTQNLVEMDLEAAAAPPPLPPGSFVPPTATPRPPPGEEAEEGKEEPPEVPTAAAAPAEPVPPAQPAPAEAVDSPRRRQDALAQQQAAAKKAVAAANAMFRERAPAARKPGSGSGSESVIIGGPAGLRPDSARSAISEVDPRPLSARSTRSTESEPVRLSRFEEAAPAGSPRKSAQAAAATAASAVRAAEEAEAAFAGVADENEAPRYRAPARARASAPRPSKKGAPRMAFRVPKRAVEVSTDATVETTESVLSLSAVAPPVGEPPVMAGGAPPVSDPPVSGTASVAAERPVA